MFDAISHCWLSYATAFTNPNACTSKVFIFNRLNWARFMRIECDHQSPFQRVLVAVYSAPHSVHPNTRQTIIHRSAISFFFCLRLRFQFSKWRMVYCNTPTNVTLKLYWCYDLIKFTAGKSTQFVTGRAMAKSDGICNFLYMPFDDILVRTNSPRHRWFVASGPKWMESVKIDSTCTRRPMNVIVGERRWDGWRIDAGAGWNWLRKQWKIHCKVM